MAIQLDWYENPPKTGQEGEEMLCKMAQTAANRHL